MVFQDETMNDLLEARQRLCIALDGLSTLADVEERVQELLPYAGMFKVGKELFARFGPVVVQIVQTYRPVFLDLKYHDIPTTVGNAVSAARELGVRMLTVHALGGKEMLASAVAAAGTVKVIAVTVLTSIGQEQLKEELHIPGTINEEVLHLAMMAKESGCAGIVCSARELSFVRPHFPREFLFVTPGIGHGEDQKRAASAEEAVKNGASILVVGRAIVGNATREERIAAAQKITAVLQ